jgi:branched-chain amino acid transport system substrate-binding protein
LKKNLDIDRVRIAIVAEKAIWADPMIKAAEAYLPMMGMEVVGTWRPARSATDVSAELTAIRSVGCHMILTMISGTVGIPLARQAGEMKIPAVIVGINVPAAANSFWEQTQGMANYVMHQSTYCENAEYNELTGPFLVEYMKRYKEVPSYTSGTHSIIKHVLGVAIEKAGTLNPDKVVEVLEKGTFKTASGITIYEKDDEGRHLHDLKYGPGYTTSLGIQWQDGKQFAVWPHFKWISPYWEYSVEPPAQPNKMSYKGLKPYVIPPWVIAAYKK